MADFYLSPLRGITDKIFRAACERRFGRFDYIVAPFIPTVLGSRVKDCHIKDLLLDGEADNVNGINSINSINGINSINSINSVNHNNIDSNNRLIPQIIGRDSAGFLLLSYKFADMGFASVNWNLGCPAPLVAKKKRGCGLLPHIDLVKKFLDETVPKLPIPLSIKTRLGYESPNDLEALMPLFNDYPIKELMIHPRTGTQLYGGTADLDKFETCLNMSKHPVVYNGDIVSVGAFKRLADRFPSVDRWMIGRGVVMNPFLLDGLRRYVSTEQSVPTVSTIYDVSQITEFLNDLLDACKDHPYPIRVLGRMKEIWRYLGKGVDWIDGVDGWENLSERVIQCQSLREYKALVSAIPQVLSPSTALRAI